MNMINEDEKDEIESLEDEDLRIVKNKPMKKDNKRNNKEAYEELLSPDEDKTPQKSEMKNIQNNRDRD